MAHDSLVLRQPLLWDLTSPCDIQTGVSRTNATRDTFCAGATAADASCYFSTNACPIIMRTSSSATRASARSGGARPAPSALICAHAHDICMCSGAAFGLAAARAPRASAAHRRGSAASGRARPSKSALCERNTCAMPRAERRPPVRQSFDVRRCERMRSANLPRVR
jgi:hypothetical protein